MIVLYLPAITNPSNVPGCSVYNSSKKILRRWVESNPDVTVLYPKIEGYEYDDWIEHERIVHIPVPAWEQFTGTQQYRRSSIPREELLMKFLGEDRDGLFYDIILNAKPRIAPTVQLLLGGVFSGEAPMINFTHFRTSVEDQYYATVNANFDRAWCYGLSHGRATFQSEEMWRRYKKEASKYLSISTVRNVHNNRVTNCSALAVSEIEEVISDVERPTDGPIILHHAGRLSASAHGEKVMELWDEVYAMGNDVKLVITSQGSVGRYARRILNELEHKGMDDVELIERCPQHQFWRTAASSHIKIANSHHGEFYFATAEQILCGLVLVVRRAGFMKEIWEDYPFSYSNMDEMRTVLNYVVENYWDESVQEPRRQLQQKMIDMYSDEVLHVGLINDMEAYVEEDRENRSLAKTLHKLIARVITEKFPGGEFTFDEIAGEIKKASDNGYMDIHAVNPLDRTNRHDWHRTFGLLGFEGRYNQDLKLKYRKSKDVDLSVYLEEES